MADARYWELGVDAPADAAEGLSNFLWELGALGVVEEETPGTPPRLRAFFSDGAAASTLAARVDEYLASLRALGFATAGAPAVVERATEDWARAWQRHFTPLPVGERLLITPPWEQPQAHGRLVVVLEPGRAFGTGHHGSTAGCLERLEATVTRTRPARGLDLGTGSGILAIAAVRLGVPTMLGVDEDPDAVAAARGNAARNEVGDRVHAVLGDARTLDLPAVPLVLANILTAAHLALAARYRMHVSPGGVLILGGILDAEAASVADALGRHGFREHARATIEGWTTLELVRTG
jgi:ribosomal protein L11 methyltransferase